MSILSSFGAGLLKLSEQYNSNTEKSPVMAKVQKIIKKMILMDVFGVLGVKFLL